MAMNMKGAFNAMMMTPVTRYTVSAGHYDDDNDWVKGSAHESTIWVVIKTGNRFSQFDEGIALKAIESGERNSDYRSVYLTSPYTLEMDDKIGYEGKFFTVLQQSPENTFNFRGFLVEASKNWRPYEN